MHIYVGNLSREVTEAELQQQFEAFGQVTSVNIVKGKRSGVSKAFGFIEMASPEKGQSAIDGLKDQKLDGRTMDITESNPPVKGKKRGGFKGGGKKRRRF